MSCSKLNVCCLLQFDNLSCILLFIIFIPVIYPRVRIAHTTAFGIPVVGHWLERELAQRIHQMGSIRCSIAPLADWATCHYHTKLMLMTHVDLVHQDKPTLLKFILLTQTFGCLLSQISWNKIAIKINNAIQFCNCAIIAPKILYILSFILQS